MKQDYSNNKGISQESRQYIRDITQDTKNRGVSTILGYALLAATAAVGASGCAGYKTIPEKNVPEVTSTAFEKVREYPSFDKIKEGCEFTPGSYENLIKYVDNKAPSVRMPEFEPDEDYEQFDMGLGCPQQFYLPGNVKIEKDMGAKSLDELIRGLSGEEIKDALKDSGYVSGLIYLPEEDKYVAIPPGDSILTDLADFAISKKFQDKYEEVKVDQIATYKIGNGQATAKVYQISGADGLNVPHVNIFTNGVTYDAVNIPEEKLKKINVEADDKLSHKLGKEGKGVEASAASALITAGGVGAISPVGGVLVGLGNLLSHNRFNNSAISYAYDNSYNPGRPLSGFLDEQDSTMTRILKPIYADNGSGVGNKELTGFIEYNIPPSDDKIILNQNGLNIANQKFAERVLSDLGRAGAGLLLYQMGKSDGKTIEKVIDGPTGGAGRPDGSGPGVISR